MPNKVTKAITLAMAAGLAGILIILPAIVHGHCDTLGGPVVKEARTALETGDITPVLKWVKKEHETELKTAFARTISVRKKGAEAKELADLYFLETLVRLHRAGEGAPYTGLKDEPLEPIVAMADKALADGTDQELIKTISSHMASMITEKFNEAREAMKKKDIGIEAGRKFVEAYIVYMHYVEAVHAAIVAAGGNHH